MVLQGKCKIPSQFPGAASELGERRVTGKEPQGEEKVNISQKSSEVTRHVRSWGNWDITAIQGLRAPGPLP